MNRLLAIVGPTGTGKSKLAIRLAQSLDGEIVSADSRQVYRYMNIGTAKPCPEEISLIPHHLIDIINPDEEFSLARYQELAYRAIKEIQGRGKLPLLVGGSGLYVWAVLEGWVIPQVTPDPEFRRELEKKASEAGKDALFQELMETDPVAAQRIDRRNVRRVIRALEVNKYADFPFSGQQHKRPPPFETIIIGLTAERAELYRRIDCRVDKMIEQGLVEEVQKLVDMGYTFTLPSMSSIGYKEIGLYLRDGLTLTSAIQQIKFETHRFVRYQYSWFQLKDDRIRWFDVQGGTEAVITSPMAAFLDETVKGL